LSAAGLDEEAVRLRERIKQREAAGDRPTP
jgi:hypothetical protein